MIIGTMVLQVVRIWLHMIQMIVTNPIMILKIAFLWLSLSFSITYIFFLLVHQQDVVRIRRDLALALGQSFLTAFFVATMVASVYEYIITHVMTSKFFAGQQHLINSLRIFSSDSFWYQRLCFLTILLSGFFAAHFVGEMLDTWYERYVAHRYGWTIMIATGLCWGFLWGVNYVI